MEGESDYIDIPSSKLSIASNDGKKIKTMEKQLCRMEQKPIFFVWV